jgi:glutaconate CoA-transferase, subunit B
VLEPESSTCELTLTQIHPGVDVEQVREATGWELNVAADPRRTPPPTEEELSALRELISR